MEEVRASQCGEEREKGDEMEERICERDDVWRSEYEIEGDGAPLVRAAETEKFSAGEERGKREGGSWENRDKKDKDENDAERDRPKRRERRYDGAREGENARGGPKVTESEEPLCGGKNGRVDSRASSSGSSGALALS